MTDKPEDPLTRAKLANKYSIDIEAELNELYCKDATMNAILKLATLNGWNELETYKRMVVQLAYEKQRYLDLALRNAEHMVFHGSGDGN